MKTEIGRELKVSELHLDTVVVLQKEDRPMATLWVREVGEAIVWFYAGVTQMNFIALRCGPDLEELRDDSDARIRVYEYLGEV